MGDDGMHIVICTLTEEPEDSCGARPRVPVLACRDVLTSAGATVELVTARSDAEIDAMIATFDGPARPDGLAWPVSDGDRRLIVAANSDSEVRGIVRRMVRRWAPPPSRRPAADLAGNRTLPDLPPIGILPLSVVKLVDELDLPRDAADVAKAALSGQARRFDLFRSDAGPVTLHGALVGGVAAAGHVAPWRGHVELDDTTLADPADSILACAIANAPGYTHLDDAGLAGIELAPRADATSGSITVAVAVAQHTKPRFGRSRVRIEVRRASGRAVSVTPDGDVPMVEDGIDTALNRKRAWWVEPGAWGVFTG
jgi:hypothetical protein